MGTEWKKGKLNYLGNVIENAFGSDRMAFYVPYKNQMFYNTIPNRYFQDILEKTSGNCVS